MMGRRGQPEYTAWQAMRARCRDKKRSGYSYYGGRGIKVCERWDSYESFLADMGPKPTPQHTLDRIDPNKNYEPSNCRWATWEEQGRNHRPKPNKTGRPGVYIESECPNRPFAARISVGGERRYLGTFATVEEATAAYNAAKLGG